MNESQTFEQFLTLQTPHVDMPAFVVNLLITAILGLTLSLFYSRYGTSVSNRAQFSRNLVLIAMTTMVIITIVKSSLALSLGLVGALSIVRFRTPIKEPEELAYLFLSIAIGLGLGAGQRAVVAIGFVAILTVIWLRRTKRPSDCEQSMHLTVKAGEHDDTLLDRIVAVLEKTATSVKLSRIDETRDAFHGDFSVAFADFQQFNEAKRALKEIRQDLQISFLDNRLA